MSDKPSDLGKTPADAVKRLRSEALECLGTRIGLHMHGEADAVEALMAESDALRERAERAEDEASILTQARDEASAERDRYREAVGRLRLVLAEAARRVRDDDGLFGAEPISETIHYALEESTDEAIQGYPEPPEPDAVLVAKANAALVAEVAELRAEHYILAGYEPPDGTRIPAGWTRADNGDWWVHESGAMEVRDCTDAGREWVVFWPEVADGLPPTAQGVAPTLFAAMRAAKEAAHALGIDTSEVKP